MNRSLLFLLAPVFAIANPAGEKVAVGKASFDRSLPQALQVQADDRAIIDWQTFSIAAGEKTCFVQAGKDAAVLNRVIGSEISEIYGSLEGNGQVFLVNPQGVLIGATGVVDCASFLAAAFEMDEDSFLKGRDFAFKNGGDAKAVNLGTIRTSSGPVFLIGPDVENGGVMIAGAGQAYMISGDEITLSSFEDPRVMIRPTAASLRKLENRGSIEAANVHLLGALAVNNEGRIEATGVERVGGRIFLVGDKIESSGEIVAEGGRIELEGGEVILTEGSFTDASSMTGGGEIQLNSSYRTVVLDGAEVAADALMEGDGGKILVLSDRWTGIAGRVSARGGMIRGNGGFIELSSKGGMALGGSVSTEAAFGNTGSLLIDPTDVTIGPGGMNNAMATIMGVDTFTYSGTPVIIDDTAFQAGGYIDSNNVTVDTGNITDQNETGNITFAFNAVLNWTSANTLTLIADNDISFIAGASVAPTGGGSIVAQAKNNISVNTFVNPTGGSITLLAGPSSGLTGFNPTGSVTFGPTGSMTTSGAGAILVQGYDITSIDHSIFSSDAGGITFQATHDIQMEGDPNIAFTNTGFVRMYADRNVTVNPGTITAMGAYSGNQIDIRADFDLNGDGDLLFESANGVSTTWTTMAGGSIFLGGNNVTLLGVQGTSDPILGELFLGTAGGSTIEVQAANDFLMQGGTPIGPLMDGIGKVYMLSGGSVLVRAGHDAIFQGGSADSSEVFITGSGGDCQVIAGNTVQLLGGTGTTQSYAYMAHDQISLTAGNNIIFTAGTGTGPNPLPANPALVLSAVSPTLMRAGGNIVFTNGPSNGSTFGFAGILDNGIGFDIRAAGGIQVAQSSHPTGSESIYIAAGATINPLWVQQFGPYLTSTVLANAASASGTGAYTVQTSPMTLGIELVTVDGQITLYSSATADLLLDDLAVANATRLASTTGNIQVGSFFNTNVNNTVSTGGAVLIATNNNLNINTPAGFITAGGPITLIVDQQNPTGDGGGFFNNFNSGVSTTDPQERIAIYAASGPTPGNGFAPIPNQVVLGNLASVETWDAGSSLGLLSKYGTSYEEGGLVHGAGYGASYVAGNGVFSSPVIWYKAFPISASLVDAGLEAMQQLSTLIPERLWLQEFSILVNRGAFKEAVKSLMRHRWKEKTMQPRIAIGRSKEYFLRTTMAGDNIRITDYYQEFEQSPFWRNPRMMNYLRALKKEAMKK